MSENINNMNIKQLRNEVQLLRDELAIMKRKYEDIIYNLDTDNFSSRFVKEQDDMRTAIEVTAEGIKTKVSNEDFESTKTQLANKIESEVKTLDGTLTSKITQAVGSIESEIEDLSSADVALSSRITQTADSISSVVAKNISVKFKRTTKPTKNNTSDEEKGMLCEYNGWLWYYNDITEKWEEYPYADGIKSQFLQTESGFQLTGDVSISGDAIVGGTITGASFQNSLQTTKLLLGAESGSYAGDLSLVSCGTYETVVFSVYDALGGIGLNSYGDSFLYTTGDATRPQGVWNFSECTSVDFGDFVVSGGKAVAVFG